MLVSKRWPSVSRAKKFRFRRIGADIASRRNKWNSGRAGRTAFTIAFATLAAQTAPGRSIASRRDLRRFVALARLERQPASALLVASFAWPRLYPASLFRSKRRRMVRAL